MWVDAMNHELEGIQRNYNKWELVDLPKDKQAIGVKWIYKVKHQVDGFVDQHKERLVAMGCSQKPRVDYSKTFSRMATFDTINIVLVIAAQKSRFYLKWM